MADLNELQSAQSVKIVGSSQTGLEQSAIESTDDGRLKTDETINGSVVQTVLNVTTSAIAARVNANNLPNRKMLYIQCQGTNIVYGFDSGSQPFILPKNTTLAFEIGSNITLYLKTTSGSGNVVIAEFA